MCTLKSLLPKELLIFFSHRSASLDSSLWRCSSYRNNRSSDERPTSHPKRSSRRSPKRNLALRDSTRPSSSGGLDKTPSSNRAQIKSILPIFRCATRASSMGMNRFNGIEFVHLVVKLSYVTSIYAKGICAASRGESIFKPTKKTECRSKLTPSSPIASSS